VRPSLRSSDAQQPLALGVGVTRIDEDDDLLGPSATPPDAGPGCASDTAHGSEVVSRTVLVSADR